MSDDVTDCPARTVYDTLVAAPALPATAYRDLIDALYPVWVEEVVCPVHVAVGHLRRAADAADAGDDRSVGGHHEAARTNLYQALAQARLLTVEERLQEVIVDDLLDSRPADEPAERTETADRRVGQGWNAWRGGWGK